MALTKKKEIFNPMEAWGEILNSKTIEHNGNFTAGDSSGKGFWIEVPVDPETFHTHPDYLGIVASWSPSFSGPQLEFLQKIGNFENDFSKFILWVIKPGPESSLRLQEP